MSDEPDDNERPDCGDCYATGEGRYGIRCPTCKGRGTLPSVKEIEDREDYEDRAYDRWKDEQIESRSGGT